MSKKRLLLPKLLFPPVVAIALLSHHIYPDDGFIDTTMEVIAIALITIGTVGRVWVSAYVSGKKNHQLVVDGPYSIVRNPLYFFSLLGFVGAGMAFETITMTLIFTMLFLATHLPTIYAEEKHLRDVFGEAYVAYCRAVPRLIPRAWQPIGPSQITFNSLLYTRAALDSSLIVCMFMMAHIIEWGHTSKLLPYYFTLP